MKKKLTQILMLLVAVVSIGAFVSCKDTNEDRYNSLSTQTATALSENASLKTALQELTQKLNDQIDKYDALEKKLAGINSCTCDLTGINNSISGLQGSVSTIQGDIRVIQADYSGVKTAIGDMKDDISDLGSNLNSQLQTITGLIKDLQNLQGQVGDNKTAITALTSLINGLQTQVTKNETLLSALTNLPNDVAQQQALIATLRTEIATLKAWKDQVKTCNCDNYNNVITVLSKLQQEMATAQAKVESALNNAASAQATATDAQTTAYNAQGTANTAKAIAESATTAAQNALDIALSISQTATQANMTAAAAKDASDKAWTLALQALTAANEANSLATQLLTRVEALKGTVDAHTSEISALQTATETIRTLVNNNKAKLDEVSKKVDTNSSDISENAKNIATNIANIANNAKDIEANANAIKAATTSINNLSSDLSAMQAKISLMSDNIQAAFDKANDAAGTATANSLEIAALKTIVQNLQTSTAGKEELNSLKQTVAELKTAIQTLSQDLNNKISGNTTDIASLKTALANLTTAAGQTDETVKDLTDRVNNLLERLSKLEGEVEILRTTCDLNLESAKEYANLQIAVAKEEIYQQIQKMLADYLKKGDVDLTKYVTKEEVANYVAKEELANYALKDELSNLVSKDVLNALMNGLNDKLNGMTQLEAALQVALQNLANDVTSQFFERDNTIASLRERITKNEADIDWLKSLYNTLDGKVGGLDDWKTEIEAWKAQIELWKENLPEGSSTTIYETIKEKISDQITQTLNTKMSDIKTEVLDSIRNDLSQGSLDTQVQQIIDQYQFTTSDKTVKLAEAITYVTLLQDSLMPGYKDELDSLTAKYLGLLTRVSTIESSYVSKDSIANFIKITDVVKLLSDSSYVRKSDLSDYAKVQELADSLKNYAKNTDLAGYAKKTDLNGYVTNDSLNSKLSGYVTIGDLAAYAKTEDLSAYATLEKLKGYLLIDSFKVEKQALLDKIDANALDISAMKGQISTLGTRLDSLCTEVTDLKNRVTKTEGRLDKVDNTLDSIANALKTDIAMVQDNLAKQVTGIKIDATNNPWFGSYTDPFGNQTNLLLAFYGIPKSDVLFPDTATSKYVDPEDALTAKDMQMLSGLQQFNLPAGKTLMYKNGYAGKIYMTINPNTADVSGLQPKIVNTLDTVSFISLTGIKPSTERLKFGFTPATRATQSTNGFYEAEARVKADDVQKIDAPTFNTAAMKEAAENIKAAVVDLAQNQSTGSNAKRLETVANDLNTIVNGLRFERSGLKVSYNSTEKQADGSYVTKEHSVYSDRNLAATAFKPLSLETLKDLNVKDIPGFKRVNNLLDRVSNTLTDKIHTFFTDFSNNALVQKIGKFTIQRIEVPEIDSTLLAKFELHMDTVFIIGGLEYEFVMSDSLEIPIMFEKDLQIPIDMNGVVVNVPVNIQKDVEIDMSQVSVQVPTVVVKGTFSGHPTDIKDKEGNPVTSLLIPIKSGDVITGYTEIPMDSLKVSVDVQAQNENAGTKIYLDGGNPIAQVVIDTTFTTSVGIHDTISYKLVINDKFKTKINISKFIQLGYSGYEKDDSEQDGYAKDEDGNLVPLKDANGNPIPGGKRGFILKFNYNMKDAAKDLWGLAANSLNNINDGLLKDVQDLIKEVNDQLASINKYDGQITGTIEDYVGKIKNYLDKINRAGTKIINSTNSRFQPFMVASTSKGMKRLSGSKRIPTELSSDITLYPTSQTMELFVPLARKHIAVTNVYSMDLKKSVQAGTLSSSLLTNINNNNEELNVVLDGTVRKVQMNGLQANYIYEVAYSALDFHGKMATRKYYITITK